MGTVCPGSEKEAKVIKNGRCLSCGNRWQNKPKEDCQTIRHKNYYQQNFVERMRRKRRELKKEVIEKYGGKCACCGESRLGFLTISHVNNDGAAHKRALGITKENGFGATGWGFYKVLKDMGFPMTPPLEVECYNCNCGKKSNNGICPHKEQSPEVSGGN